MTKIEDDKQYRVRLNKRTLLPARFGGIWLTPRDENLLAGVALKALLASEEAPKVDGYEEA